MSSAWQTLNPPVELSRIIAVCAPVLDTTLPPGETLLTVIGTEDDSCAVRPTLLSVIDRSKGILGTGAGPQKPVPAALDASICAQSVTPRKPSSVDRITLIFRSELPFQQTSHPRMPVDPPRAELDPVMRKPLVWSPPPVANHPCDPPRANFTIPKVSLRDPADLNDLTQTPPFETRPVALAETVAAVETGMPNSLDARLEVNGIPTHRNPLPVRLIGPRLRIGLPTLQ